MPILWRKKFGRIDILLIFKSLSKKILKEEMYDFKSRKKIADNSRTETYFFAKSVSWFFCLNKFSIHSDKNKVNNIFNEVIASHM
jgi:hypothetical protein